MPSEKEIKAAARAICDRGIRALDGTQATWERHADDFIAMADDALSAAEKEREGETHNGVCLRCGSGVLASGEHIRTDLPPCSRQGDIIEQLREWVPRNSATYDESGDFLIREHDLLHFLNDLQEQSTPKEEV